MAAATAPPSWILKGEGNANLVFAYSGQDPLLTGLVLRVRKGKVHHAKEKSKDKHGVHEAAPEPHALATLEDRIWQGVLQASDTSEKEYEYVASYVSGLLGADYVHPGVRVHVPEEVVSTMVAQGMAPPPHDLPALLMPDLASFSTGPPAGHEEAGPVVCVEIKPKAGCMPDSKFLHPGTAALKARYPRFLMHCVLKNEEGKGQLSAYDPRDLFSREPSRMQRALNALLVAPNNNLRVFVGGKLVYGGRPAQSEGDSGVYANHTSSTSTQNLGEALEAAFGGSGSAGSGQGAVDQLVQAVCEVLRREELLTRVLHAQQTDKVDVEGAVLMYNALLAQYSVGAPSGAGYEGTLGGWDESELLQGLRGYLTAMTAKDCGIMITLQPVKQLAAAAAAPPATSATLSSTQEAAAVAAEAPVVGGQVWPAPEQAVRVAGSTLHPQPRLLDISSASVHPSGRRFMYRVAALDLDLKRIAKLPTHAKLDKDVLAAAAAAPELCEVLLAGQLPAAKCNSG